MTDIVKRLRRYCADTGLKSHTIDEAADEIERLREALEFYADVSNYHARLTGGLGDLYFDCATIARAALEESK